MGRITAAAVLVVATLIGIAGCGRKQAAEWDVPANWGKREKLVTTEYENVEPVAWGFRTELDQQRQPHVIASLAIPILKAPPGGLFPTDDLDVYASVIDDKGRMINEAAVPHVSAAIQAGAQGPASLDIGSLPADSKRVLLRWMRRKSDSWRPVYWTLDIPADRTPQKGS